MTYSRYFTRSNGSGRATETGIVLIERLEFLGVNADSLSEGCDVSIWVEVLGVNANGGRSLDGLVFVSSEGLNWGVFWDWWEVGGYMGW